MASVYPGEGGVLGRLQTVFDPYKRAPVVLSQELKHVPVHTIRPGAQGEPYYVFRGKGLVVERFGRHPVRGSRLRLRGQWEHQHQPDQAFHDALDVSGESRAHAVSRTPHFLFPNSGKAEPLDGLDGGLGLVGAALGFAVVRDALPKAGLVVF